MGSGWLLWSSPMSFHGCRSSFVGSGGWLWSSLAGGGSFLGSGGHFHEEK